MFSSPRMNDLDHKVSRNLSMVKLFYQNKDYDTAKSYVNESLKLKPNSSEAYKLLSQIHEATGDNDLAMQYYKKALELRTNSFDPNSSLDNNRHFTPTKSNHFGGTPNNVSPQSSIANNNVSPQLANTENITKEIEKLLDGKITAMLFNFQSNVNQQITQLNGNVDKIGGDLSYIKKKLDDFQKQLIFLRNKQDEMSNKLAVSAATPPKDSGDVKKQIEALSHSVSNLARDNSKILNELSELKESVVLLHEKGNYSDDYNEEGDDYEDDYEENNQPQQSSTTNGPEKPKLGQLTKKVDKDSWNCPTCDTPNSKFASACACCETLNPNSSVAGNGPTVPEPTQFKFGTSSGSFGFSFGAPAAALAAPAPAAPALAPAAAPAAPTLAPTASALAPTTTPFSFKLPSFTSTSIFPTTKSTAPVFSFPSVVPISKSVDSVELIYEKQPKPEHLDTIKKLMLPPNFYDYEDKAPCPGCIGCEDATNSGDSKQAEPVKVGLTNFFTSSTAPITAPSTAPSVPPTTDFGLFSSIATDLNLVQNKVDTIGSGEADDADNDHMKDKNFVSEKSKLLPEKFEVKTGEEDEDVLFNERCKIYHFVTEEWKERGVGNMKVLKRKDTNVFRLLMRRDKIFNVVCNQGISKGLSFKPFQNSSNTLTWGARDYSDEAAGLDKLFAVKFKNESIMKQFENTIKDCIEKMSQ